MLRRLLALALASLLTLSACGSETDSGDDTASDPAQSASEAESSTESSSEAASEDPAAGESSAAATTGTCVYTPDGMPVTEEVALPPGEPTQTGRVEVTLTTNVGDLTASLDAKKAPCTVNSFVSLAEQGFYESNTCHRLTTDGIYVLQCGDPTGTGAGGPGYAYADELSGKETYGPGTLAMANAGPNTNGSQFFLVYADSSVLDPAYTVFGQLDTASVKALEAVAAKGTQDGGSDGAPKEPVTIESVTVG